VYIKFKLIGVMLLHLKTTSPRREIPRLRPSFPMARLARRDGVIRRHRYRRADPLLTAAVHWRTFY
jgi:hypothetical protein